MFKKAERKQVRAGDKFGRLTLVEFAGLVAVGLDGNACATAVLLPLSSRNGLLVVIQNLAAVFARKEPQQSMETGVEVERLQPTFHGRQ